MIKCSICHCKNNKDNICLLKEISIDCESDFEVNSSYCVNHDPTKFFIRSLYELVKLDDNKYLVIGKTKEPSFQHYVTILEEIQEIEKNNKIPEIYIDDIVRFGSKAYNRCFYCKKGCLDVFKLDKETVFGKKITELTCNYLKRHDHILNASVLSEVEKNLIRKGVLL